MFIQRFLTLSSALVFAIGINPVSAQKPLPACQSPNAGEYILLVVSPTANNQKQLRSALPNELNTVNCKYLNERVTRIGGFKNIDDANRWAKYVNNIVGLSAIITTRPAVGTISNQPIKPSLNYQPKALGAGYAVLVDYFNRPELASNVQQIVGGNVGLASYGQRPYLLALHTTNQNQATKILQKLNERGYFALLVDSRKVVLLRSVVSSQ